MSAKANYFKIGLFVMSAVTIAVIAIIVLGAGALFRKQVLIETYIEESVQGLDIGSPVKFRGVQIGNVVTITLVGKEYPTNRRYVLVRGSLLPDVFPVPTEQVVTGGLKKEIERGLRVRLASQGLTGTAYLEADYLDPKRSPPLEVDWSPRHAYIPSAPSTITRLSDSVDKILRNLKEINVQGLTRGLETSLAAVSGAIEEAQIDRISAQTEKLLIEVRETNRRIGSFLERTKIEPILSDASATMATARRIAERSEKPLDRLLADLPEASANIRNLTDKWDALTGDLPEVIAQTKRTLRRLDNLISGQQQEIETTVENFRLLSQNLKELTENAKKYPAQILFGGPPPPTEDRNRR